MPNLSKSFSDSCENTNPIKEIEKPRIYFFYFIMLVNKIIMISIFLFSFPF